MSRHFEHVKFGYAKNDYIYRLDWNNIFNFIGDNTFIKLNSRHNNCSQYPTTIIGYNKRIKASELNKEVYFFFCFDDCLAYLKNDKNYDLLIKRGGWMITLFYQLNYLKMFNKIII